MSVLAPVAKIVTLNNMNNLKWLFGLLKTKNPASRQSSDEKFRKLIRKKSSPFDYLRSEYIALQRTRQI